MLSRRLALAGLATLATTPLAAQRRWPPAVDEHVAAVRRTVRTIDMAGFAAVVADPRGALLLDVREADEVAQSRIPGTRHLPRGLLEFRIWGVLGHPAAVALDRPIYLHCLTGYRATLSARQLEDVGLTKVTAVLMDLGAWERAGLPFER